MAAMALPQCHLAYEPRREGSLSDLRRRSYTTVNPLDYRCARPLRRESHILHGGRQREEIPRTLRTRQVTRASPRQPHLQPPRRLHRAKQTLSAKRKRSRQTHTVQPLPTATRMDAKQTIHYPAPPLYYNNVGLSHTRLLQTPHRSRCPQQRQTIRSQRLHHHLPRLPAQHRQTENRTPAEHRMAAKRRLRIQDIR